MKKNKKLIIAILLVVILLTVSGVLLFKYQSIINEPISYEWVKEEGSVINQQRLYINNKNNKHIEGYVRITYLKGNSVKEKIPKEGKLYVKSVIKKVKVINKRR